MYSGLVLTRYSGRLMGAHQKIDRIARRHLAELTGPTTAFPRIRSILHFEGKNGPDGVKRKNPGKEPWHFFDPLSGDDEGYLKLLSVHYEGLVSHLKTKNKERASFEAAWLAHAIVDGLTPAHHYPFDEKASELRGGKDPSTRATIWQKWIFTGDTLSKTIASTMKAWGPRGLFTAHVLFEAGFTFIIRPLRFPDARPTANDIALATELGYQEYFLRQARKIAHMKMFDAYLKDGWTNKLSRQVREELAPTVVRTATIIWYLAEQEAAEDVKL